MPLKTAMYWNFNRMKARSSTSWGRCRRDSTESPRSAAATAGCSAAMSPEATRVRPT